MIFLPPEQLGDLIKNFEKDSQSLREQITEICLYMEGGLEFNSAWGMSYLDREIAVKVINRKMKKQNPGTKEYF